MNGISDQLAKDDHDRVLRQKILPATDLDSLTSHERPRAIILGGQPGAGKGGLVDMAREHFGHDVLVIDPDEMRAFHPQVEEFRRQNPVEWAGRTHLDASPWATEVLDVASSDRKALILDKTLANGESASALIGELQAKGYDVEVRVVAAHKLESELGVDNRFTAQIDKEGYGRHVPKAARDAIYESIPSSLDTIQRTTSAPISIYNREGQILYDSRVDPRPAGEVLAEERVNRLKIPAVTEYLRTKWPGQVDWHEELPARRGSLPNMDSPTHSRLVGEQAATGLLENAKTQAQVAATVDEVFRPGAPAAVVVREPSAPNLKRVAGVAGGAALGLAATAYDAHETGQRVHSLLQEKNATAAKSEALHFAARGLGGWTGGAVAAFAVGSTGAGPMALIAADAYLFSKAFEKAAILRDNHTVYHQTDKADTEWKYNGYSWVRESMIDRTDDGVDNPIKQQISATYEKTRELNAMANARAVELELGKVPPPQNPFSIPARAEDQRGLDNANWHRNAENGEWSRQVKSGVAGANDRGTYTTEVATPERARELDAEAVDRVQYNISNGREAVAAAYLQYRAEQRFGDFDAAVPAAVTYAQAKPDAVLGSDSRLYQRNADGQWQHGSEVAQGNLALELDLTQQMRQPTLDQAAATLAQTEALPAPTPAEQERSELLHRYQNFNVRLDEEWVPAIELATARTREANGITGRTAQELQPVEGGLYALDSAITHYAIGSDGAARRVAVTTGEEVRQAYAELQAQRQDSPPIQEASALRIDAFTPQQAEAHEQALREANRAGLSTEQAGKAAMLAAQMQGRDSGEHSNAIDLAAAPSAVERGVAADRAGDEAAVAEAARIADAASAAAHAAARPVELNESTNPPSPSTDADHARQQSEQRERDATRAEQEGTRVEQEATRAEHDRATQAQVDANERAEVPPPASAHAPVHPTEHPASNELPEVALQPSVAASQTENAHAALPEATADQPVQPSPGIPEVESLAERHSEPAIQGAEPVHERNAEHAHAYENMERELPPPTYEAQPQEALSAPRTPVRDEVPEQVAPASDLVPADEPATTSLEPSDPAHPAHALYRQVREQVERLDESLGRNYDATSERLTDSLMVLAKENGLERVDHVMLSNQTGDKPPGYNVFVVQGELDNPAHRRVSMPTEQAVQTPHEESMARLDDLLQHDAEQEQQVTQQRQQEHDTMQQEIQFAAMHMGGGGGGGG